MLPFRVSQAFQAVVRDGIVAQRRSINEHAMEFISAPSLVRLPDFSIAIASFCVLSSGEIV